MNKFVLKFSKLTYWKCEMWVNQEEGDAETRIFGFFAPAFVNDKHYLGDQNFYKNPRLQKCL